jgi:hypothetical protein
VCAPSDAPSNPVQEVGTVAGFFEGFIDVLVEGAIFGKMSLGMDWLLSRRWGAWWRDLELLVPVWLDSPGVCPSGDVVQVDPSGDHGVSLACPHGGVVGEESGLHPGGICYRKISAVYNVEKGGKDGAPGGPLFEE